MNLLVFAAVLIFSLPASSSELIAAAHPFNPGSLQPEAEAAKPTFPAYRTLFLRAPASNATTRKVQRRQKLPSTRGSPARTATRKSRKSSTRGIKASPDCGSCHEEAVKVHRGSIHGQAIQEGISTG